MPKLWWQNRALRIVRPRVRAFEWHGLDVPRLVGDCLAAHAEAVVIDAGGSEALYLSQVPYHRVSPAIGRRDLLAEIVAEARRQGLRVIAGVDFSVAREEVRREHPQWLERRADGEVVRSGAGYLACPLGGYANEGFAYPVLREILTRYKVDGLELRGGGFGGYCYCEACVASFGRPLPRKREGDPQTWTAFLCWRSRVVAEHLASICQVIGEIDPEALLITELAGPQRPREALSSGQHLPSLAQSAGQLLLTSGGVGAARQSRWWASLAADRARAARRSKRHPLVDVDMTLRDLGQPQAPVPPAEFALACYQALAHGAGLQVSTTGLLEHQLDPRARPALAAVFGFMRQQQEVLDTMEPIAHVALIWPEQALLRSAALEGEATEGLRGEFLGLFNTLMAHHVLFGLLYDELMSPHRLRRYETVVLPTAVWLSDEQAEALAGYVREGGRLVLLDSPAANPAGTFRPMPRALAELLGGAWSEEAREARYATPTTLPVLPASAEMTRLAGLGLRLRSMPRSPSETPGGRWGSEVARRSVGLLPLGQPYRRVVPAEAAQVWLRNARVLLEEQGDLEPGEDALLLAAPAGDGLVVYAATGLGQMFLDSGHPDYADLLAAMVSHSAVTKPNLLTDAPSYVGVSLAQWKLGVVIHLVNAAGPVPLDAPAPVGPIQLDLAWDGPGIAQLCAPGAEPQEIPCEECWNRLAITVPRLGAYAQVVVRSA